MICALEIGLLVWGIVVLTKGSVSLTKQKVVRGTPAYVMGVLMMLPLPVAFVTGAVLGVVLTVQNQGNPPENMFIVATVSELVILAGFGLTIFAIGLVNGRTQAEWDAIKAAEQTYGGFPPARFAAPSDNPYQPPRDPR